ACTPRRNGFARWSATTSRSATAAARWMSHAHMPAFVSRQPSAVVRSRLRTRLTAPARSRALELSLAVRALCRDLPVVQGQEVAALHLEARRAARRAGRQPLDHGEFGAREVPDLVPADVRNPLEHLLEELADRRLADDARAPGVLDERRLEDHVVGRHREDPLDVVPVPHGVELIHERLAVDCLVRIVLSRLFLPATRRLALQRAAAGVVQRAPVPTAFFDPPPARTSHAQYHMPSRSWRCSA